MNKFIKNFTRILFTVIISGLSLTCFFSCQKAEPDPYSTPTAGVTHTVSSYTINPHDTAIHDTTKPAPPDTTPSFKAAVNGGSVITFTPSKSINGSNITLKGVSSFYTLTITFPNSTAPGGPYNIGFPSTTISATVVNGATTYVDNYNSGVGGSLTIDSISSKGKYYGTFHFEAIDSVSFTTANVTQGSFYHL